MLDGLLNKLTGHPHDEKNKGASKVSHSASHIDLTKDKSEQLSDYYDDMSVHPINSLRFRNAYLAKHRTTQEYRCIKDLSKRTISKEFFWAEVKTYQTLYHPNILHLYETLEDSKAFYCVVDRLDHPNLYQAIPKLFQNPTDFDEVQVALVVRCILKALMYCHEKGIVHSALTYEDILLDPKKGLRSLYICGFGYARLNREYRNYHHRSNSSRSTNSESFRTASSSVRSSTTVYSYDSGDDDEEEEHEQAVETTDLFSAPETRMGDLSVFEEASDIWSTGVIAYQLLTRRNPFEDKDIWPVNYRDLKWKADHFANSPYLEHLSDESKDFLQQLLTYRPEGRPTAEESLKHPWFQCCERAGNRIKKTALNSALSNLQNFHANTKLEQATRMYIVNNLLRSEDRAQLDACFRYLDKNRNNVITRDELRTALEKARPKDKVVRIDTMLENIFDRIDVQKTGEIDYSEFLAAAADDSVVLTRENLFATFNAFDKSRTGTINVSDLKTLFNQGREKKVISTRDAKRLIVKVDPNGDGEISFEEFCQFMHADNW